MHGARSVNPFRAKREISKRGQDGYLVLCEAPYRGAIGKAPGSRYFVDFFFAAGLAAVAELLLNRGAIEL